MEIKNWILKKHLNNFEIISENYLPFYKDYLISKGVIVEEDFSKSQSFVNWNLYPENYKFFYDFEGCENEITQWLMNSDLSKSKKVSMDLGYNNPIIVLNTNYFINNWYDFVVGAQYESTLASEDGKYIMEFLKGYDLKSNFLIKKVL